MRLRRVFQLSLALLVASLGVAFAAPAGAVDNPDYTSPPPSTVITTPPPETRDREVVTAVAVTPVRSQMAITGSDAAQTAAIGAALVAAGGLVMVARRRTATA